MISKKSMRTVVKWLVIGVLLLISLFPIYWMVSTSFKYQVQAFSIPPVWLFVPTLSNYAYVFFRQKFMVYMFNSTVIALTSAALTLLLGSLSAYGLSRFRMIGGAVFSIFTLILRMVAPAIVVLPLWILWDRFGLINTRTGVIFAYVALNLPFTIWILMGFMKRVPIEIDEAAMIDGCSPLHIFFRIMLPLTAPGAAAAAIFTFRMAWNEFLLNLVLSNQHTRGLPPATSLYLTETGVIWGSLTAMGTLIAVPAFVFCLVAGRSLIKGLTAGAVKG